VNKKKQKNFIHCAGQTWRGGAAGKGVKVFLLLFLQKKKALLAT
jgi:hypothetical protein